MEKVFCALVDKLYSMDIKDTTQLKVYKLLYLVYVWFGVLYNKKITAEEPIAYRLGPVFESVRDKYKSYKDDIILNDLEYGFDVIKEKRLKEVIEGVVGQYGKMSAYDLVEITHNELWELIYYHKKNKTMPFKTIVEYYKNNLADAVKVQYDKKENVFIATSEIIKGLVLENKDRQELEREIQEIGTDLIKLNYNA